MMDPIAHVPVSRPIKSQRMALGHSARQDRQLPSNRRTAASPNRYHAQRAARKAVKGRRTNALPFPVSTTPLPTWKIRSTKPLTAGSVRCTAAITHSASAQGTNRRVRCANRITNSLRNTVGYRHRIHVHVHVRVHRKRGSELDLPDPRRQLLRLQHLLDGGGHNIAKVTGVRRDNLDHPRDHFLGIHMPERRRQRRVELLP